MNYSKYIVQRLFLYSTKKDTFGPSVNFEFGDYRSEKDIKLEEPNIITNCLYNSKICNSLNVVEQTLN